MKWWLAAVVGLIVAQMSPAAAQDKAKKPTQPTLTIVASDTAEASGVLGRVLPPFAKRAGLKVRVLSRGTIEMVDIVKKGGADLVIIDDQPAELALIKSGDAVGRRDMMYSELMIVGPRTDPASVKGMVSAVWMALATPSTSYGFTINASGRY